MVIQLEKKFDSESKLYFTVISLYNVINGWGLTDTHINILIYLIRLGYSSDTKEIICENLKITPKSLTTTLSHLRTGKIGKKKIEKLLSTSHLNQNVTILNDDLKYLKSILESKDSTKCISFDFGEERFIDKTIREIKVHYEK